jgi:Protein of unknown function, DUF481
MRGLMSRSWLVIAAIVLVTGMVTLVTGTAHAQIVNVQGALAKAPDKDDTTGQVELKVNWREGNNPLFDIGGAGSFLVRRGHILGLVLARGEYGTSRGLTLTKKSFEHMRMRVELDCRWRWEAFLQHEYDQFRRLSLRAVVGTGPAFQIIDTKPIAVLAGAAYLFEYEELDNRPGTFDAGARATAHRGSVYVTGHENLGSGVVIVETAYAQPRLNEPSDVRVLGEFSVLSQLSSRIALKDSFTVAYDHTPPDGVKRYDTALEVGVLVTF